MFSNYAFWKDQTSKSKDMYINLAIINGMHVRTRKRALAEGVTAGTLFGTAAVLIRFLPDSDTFTIAFWRVIIASAVLALILVFMKKKLNLSFLKKNLKDLSLLSLFLGLHFILFTSAVKDTTILNATVLVNTTPIFSMFVSSLVYKLKPSRYAVFGLILSFMGICVIAYAESQSSLQTAGTVGFYPNLKGDVEAVLAAVVESFYLNMGRKVRGQMNILSIMTPIYLLTAVVIGVIGVPVSGGLLSPPFAFETLLALIGLGILPTAVAHTLYFSSLSHLKSYETAAMALLEPIGATILGIGIFKEIPEPVFALGAVFVLVGVAFILTRRGRETRENGRLNEK